MLQTSVITLTNNHLQMKGFLTHTPDFETDVIYLPLHHTLKRVQIKTAKDREIRGRGGVDHPTRLLTIFFFFSKKKFL